MTLMEQGHLTEDALEAYAMGKLADPEAETFEEHLLLCAGCQDRLQEMDEFVASFKVAAARLGNEDVALAPAAPFSARLLQPLRSLWKDWTPLYALGGAAVAAALVIAVLPRSSGPTPHPAAIELNAVRGTVPVVVAAPEAASLNLSLDLTGLPEASRLKLEIAGSTGQVLWVSEHPRPSGDKLVLAPPIHPRAGLYWVRVYDASGDQSLLREFGLRLK
jgi:hypothetical protein